MICLYGESAMEFWHIAQVMEARVIDAYAQAGSCPEEDELVLTNYLEGRRIPLSACGTPSLKRDRIEQLAAKHMLTLPLKLVVGDKRNNRNSPELAQTTVVESCSGLDEFILVDESLAVASPTFCITSSAEKLDAIALAQLLSRTMSSYVLDTQCGSAILRSNMLARKEDLILCGNALARTGCTRQIGRVNKVLKILECIAENAYSPRESALQLLLCLPKRLGGFGLPTPLLNPDVAIEHGVTLKPDLFWPTANLDLEYNGLQYHSSDEQIRRDKVRKSLLIKSGIKVIDMDKKRLGSVVETRRVATEIAKELGTRLRTEGRRFAEKHEVLRSRLLDT